MFHACWERADLLALLCDVFSCPVFFFTLLYIVPGQVWYLIVSIPDVCLPLNFGLFLLFWVSPLNWTVLGYVLCLGSFCKVNVQNLISFIFLGVVVELC